MLTIDETAFANIFKADKPKPVQDIFRTCESCDKSFLGNEDATACGNCPVGDWCIGHSANE